MSNKSYCNPGPRLRATNGRNLLLAGCIVASMLAYVPEAVAGGDAPPWMRSLVNAPIPSYDEKTDAVLLYSETNVTVVSVDKIRTQIRKAYKILRPSGRERGIAFAPFYPQRKIKSFHGWCIPAQGKDYEVKDKDAIEIALNVEGGELVS